MDLTHIFLALAVCFLVRVEYGSARSPVTLQSHYRVKDGTCGGGNLLKIHIDSQCRASNGLCGVRCNGASTQDARTRFKVKKAGGKKCIQFTDTQDGSKYSLKVTNASNVAFEKRPCDNTVSDEFRFEEALKNDGGKRLYIYKHTISSNTMCLGVSSNCNDKNVYFISSNMNDRRCFFVKRRH